MHLARNDFLDQCDLQRSRDHTLEGRGSFDRYFDLAHAKDENKGSVARSGLSLVSVDHVRTSCDIVVPRTMRIERVWMRVGRSMGTENHENFSCKGDRDTSPHESFTPKKKDRKRQRERDRQREREKKKKRTTLESIRK